MQYYEELYERSKQLIDNNPNLTTKAIPDELLEFWLYNGEVVPNPPIELSFAILVYKYAYDRYGNPSPGEVDDGVRFSHMQYALATEYICRQSGAKLRPRRIFDFARCRETLHIDIKKSQLNRFNALAREMYPIEKYRRDFS